MEYIHGNELCHYSVPGMKWGVRRYQNADGTLTAKGKARYSSVERKYKNAQAEQKRFDSINKRKGTMINPDGRSLKDRLDRAQYALEKTYAENPNSQSAVKAKKALKDMRKTTRKAYNRSASGKTQLAAHLLGGLVAGLPVGIFLSSHPEGKRFAANAVINEYSGKRYEDYAGKAKEYEDLVKELIKKKG